MNPPPLATAQPRNSRRAIWSMVFGILSLTCLSILATIPAIVLGHLSIEDIKKSAGQLTGRGMAIAGLIMGYVGIAFGLLILPALLLPAVSQALYRAKVAGTRVNINGIDTALRMYQMEYGRHPDGRTTVEIAQALAGRNPKQIVFFEPSDAAADGLLRDAWGGPFEIAIDHDQDGSVTVGAETIQRPVAIWSHGSNRRNEFGAGDDIASWR